MTDNPQPRSLLQARNLSMAFGGLVVFRNISLDITEHQIVALIGPNGAGKTTLSTRLLFDGHDVEALAAAAEEEADGRPLVVLAYTDPCRGVECLEERRPKLHYVRFKDDGERGRFQTVLDRMGEG